MEEILRQELLAKTKRALDADDWNAVVRLWQPWVQRGDAEAKYRLAYHYLWCTPCDDEATCDRMKELLRDAASKDHPDARWYRLAAEKGNAESQYDLGFMLLLGEGGQKNTEEGLMWLERAGGQGEYSAFRLLVDSYENGYCEVPVDAAKAQLWRSRLEEHRASLPPVSTSSNPILCEIRTPSLGGSDQRFGLAANATWQRAQSVRSLNPPPLRIIGTHFSARATRVFACFAPET